FVTVKKKGDIDIEDGDVVGNRRAVTKDDIEASWEGLNTDKSRRAKLQKEYDDPSTSAARKKEIEQERANLKSEKYGQENVLMDNSKKQFKIDKANKKAKADLDEKFKDAPDDIKKQWDEVSSLMDPQKSKKMTAKEINEANQKMNKLAKDMRDQGLISEGDYNKFKKAYKTKRAKTRLEAFKDARANIGSLSKAMDTDELDKKRAELEEKKKKKQQEKDDLDNEEKNLAKQDQKIKDDLNDLDEKIRQKKNELSKTEDSINSKRQEFDNDQKELGTKKDKLKKDYDDGVADYDAKIADLRKKMDGDAKDLGDVTKQYEELGIQKNKEISDIKNLGKNKIVLEASNKQLNAIKRGLDGKNQKIRDLDAEASSLRNKSSELDSKTVDANQKFRDTETNINNRNKKISDDAEAEITNRNREIADLESQLKLDSGSEATSLRNNRQNLDDSEMVDSSGNKKFNSDDYGDGKAFDQDTIKGMDNDANNYVKANKEIDAIGDDLGISGKNKSADDIEAALDKKNKKAEGDVNELNKDLDGIGNLNKKLDDLNNTKQPKAKAELADLESKRNAIGKDSDFDPKKAPPETIKLKWDPAKDKFDVPSFDKITKADFDTLETKIKEKFGDSATSAKMGQLNKLRKNWENGQRKAFAVESSKLTTISTGKKGGKLTQSNPEFEAWKAKKREYD
ncbi:MAG: hypothetical protein OEY33_09735, partial [Bdellovibrionales bacterium]|nr:hypothetical protein [Bdellovibrionales bacterium]